MILHVRPVGLLTGTRVERGVGRFGALAAEWLRLRVRAGSGYAPCYVPVSIFGVLRTCFFCVTSNVFFAYSANGDHPIFVNSTQSSSDTAIQNLRVFVKKSPNASANEIQGVQLVITGAHNFGPKKWLTCRDETQQLIGIFCKKKS